jgi:4-amino-4-deoxy-L-arabinose transferase-like glycosyltransferase
VRPAVLGLLAATAVLYLWDLSASGWANAYYTAAVQAGSQSWKAMFFGSFDASSFVTVDKTPGALWVMDLSARLFGFSAWSVLAPQALEGVAAVGVLYLAVRRHAGAAAGLIAGAVLALTPVSAVMFRFNNPDALLVLLLVGAAYALLRALERASTRWLVLAGALVGAGYLAKMLQALLVVPVLAGVYLLVAPTPVRRRLLQLLAAGAALVVAAGWWVAVVALVPASARPYIGGSQTNSVLDLTLGYNGLGRLTGAETGSVGGGGGGGGWGSTGLLRMFDSDFGMQVSYLVPAALVLLGWGLWATRRAAHSDVGRAGVLLWGGWLLVTGLVFSYMQGIIHSYYTVALAPAIGGLVGTGAVLAWRQRSTWPARGALAGALVVTAWWTAVLLGRAPSWHPWLRPVVVAAALFAAVAVLAGSAVGRTAATTVAAVGLVGALAAPAAATVATAATPHTGSIPSASPAVARAGGFGPGARGGALRPPAGAPGGRPGGFGGRGAGGLLDAATPDAALVTALRSGTGQYTWAAATVGANRAAGLQIASGRPVMAIGGFNGSDPTPTLAQFQQDVAAGEVHWFVAGGTFGPSPGGAQVGTEISAWVEQHFPATTIGGVTVYDLTSGSTTS